MSEEVFDPDLVEPPTIRPGDVLSRSFRLCGRAFPLYVALTALLILPATLLEIGLIGQPDIDMLPERFDRDFWIEEMAGWLELLILGPIAQAVLQAWIFPKLTGGSAGLRPALRLTARRGPAIVATTFVYYFFVVIGWAALVFPGIIIAVRTMVAAPACLLEGLSPLAALRRSQELTRGHRWKIFGLSLVCTIPPLVVEGAASIVAKRLAGPDVASLVDLLVLSIATAFWAVLNLVLYQTLRVAHDGAGAEQIVTVFD